MGLFGTMLAFGAGYATGMKLGDKPMEKLRETTRQMRDRTGTASPVDLRPVTEVMSTTVETVPGGTNLVEATQRMARADIGDVLVVDSSGALRGIITDRDIAIRVVAEGQDPQDVRVADGMSSAVSVGSNATVEEAMEVMRQARHPPDPSGGHHRQADRRHLARRPFDLTQGARRAGGHQRSATEQLTPRTRPLPMCWGTRACAGFLWPPLRGMCLEELLDVGIVHE